MEVETERVGTPGETRAQPTAVAGSLLRSSSRVRTSV